MSTYRAQVRVEDGTLHVSRPLTAPDYVADVVSSMQYDVVNSEGRVVAVELVVETAEDSGTPVGDSLTATTSQPLPPPADDDHATGDDVVEQLAAPAVPR